MTSALFLLRCAEVGITMNDLEVLDVGMVYDMFIERANDDCEYAIVADQSDFNKF